jgi:RHS repeat-associated protein
VFAHYLHYKDDNGKWQEVDLTFRADGSEFVADKHDVIVRVSGAALLAMQRGTGKGIRWLLPVKPSVQGREATFKGQAGLTWTYTTRTAGPKLTAPVASALGPRTYSFDYQLLGRASALTVDAEGNLESDAFEVPVAVIYGADGNEYPASAWKVVSDSRVSFDFDDTSLPASAYPYTIDPTTTFNVATSGDDTGTVRSGPTYPPTGSITTNHSTSTGVTACRDKSGTTYSICNGFIRWNTSALPDNAVINTATARIYVWAKGDANNRSITADWYSAWPIDASDHTAYYQITASNLPGWDITNIALNADNDFPLADPDTYVSRTSYTGLRFHTTGGVLPSDAPTGLNRITMASWDATQTEPRLTIIYDNLPPGPTTLDLPADGTNVPTATPVLSATSSDPNGDPLNFWFDVDDNSNFSSLVASSGWRPTTPTWTVPAGKLKDQTTYYWRAKSQDPDGFESGWSASRSFAVRVAKLGSRDYWPMWSRGSISVNQASGNLVLTAPGPSYPTQSGTMGASASFNTFSAVDNGLGVGWVLNFGDEIGTPPLRMIDHNVVSDPANKFDAVEVAWPEGGSDFYTHIGTSKVYESAAGEGSELRKNADNSGWSLFDSDGAIYAFGQAASGTGVAALTGATIADGTSVEGRMVYTYAGSPLKIQRIDEVTFEGAPARSLTFNWYSISPSLCGNAIVCVVGPDNVTWRYIGDGGMGAGTSGRLIAVNNGVRNVLGIAYDASGRPQTIVNANDLDPTNPNTSPGYNPAHALTLSYVSSTDSRLAEVKDGPVTGQNPADAKWTFTYVPGVKTTGQPDGPSAPAKTHADIAAGAPRTADGYTTVTPPNQQSQPSPKKTRVYYDNLGRTMEAWDTLGNKTLVSYTTKDQLLWSEDEAGNPTDNEYDPVLDVLTKTIGPDPDGPMGLNRPETEFRYDETKIGTASTPGPALTGVQGAYYLNPNLAWPVENRWQDSAIDFNWGTGGPDATGGITDNFSVRWTGYINLPSQGQYVFSTVADDGTRLTVANVSMIDDWGAGSVHTTNSGPLTLPPGLTKFNLEYQELTGAAEVHLRWQCANCAPAIPYQVIPGANLKPGWANQTSAIDPSDRITFHHFNEPAFPYPDYDLVQVSGQNLITSYTWNFDGRPLSKWMPKGNAGRTIDANGNLTGTPDNMYRTTWTYYSLDPPAGGAGPYLPTACAPPNTRSGDNGGQVASIQHAGMTMQSFYYDVAGRGVADTRGAGTTCNTYDSEGRMTSDKAPGEGAATTYTYDPAGAQRTATDANGTITTDYDEAGRVKRSVDSLGAESTFLYDADGNMSQRKAATGSLGSSDFVTNYVYDATDQLISLTDPASRAYSFTYDSRGYLHTIQMPNSTYVWQDFNAAGWLTGLYNRHGTLPNPIPATVPADSNALSDYTYTFNTADGKKSRETRSGGGFTTQTTDYTYDAAGRLTTANIPDASNNHTLREYVYDLDSNRTQVKDNMIVVATGVYDQTNPASDGVDQLTSYTTGGSTKTYGYTSDGQVSSRGSDSLTWDGRRRMTGGTFSGATVAYAFDAVGRIRSRTSGGTTTQYRYSGTDDAALFDTTSSGAIQVTGVDGPAGNLARYSGAPQSGTPVEFAYYTGHGDLAATADPAGVRTATFTYDPLGIALQTPPTNASLERWTGKWDKRLDTTSSLIQMGARPYDPLLGRFLAVDPVEGGSLNNYDYAAQDPVNTYDLGGMRPAEPDTVAGYPAQAYVRARNSGTDPVNRAWCRGGLLRWNRLLPCLRSRSAANWAWSTAARLGGTEGEVNALRHCLWAASMTSQLGSGAAWGFLRRHEKGRLGDYGVDMHNNRVGASIGRGHRGRASIQRACVARMGTLDLSGG